MRTISKRETFLLFIMGMIAIVGILYMLVIKPLMAEIAENRQILSDAESKQTMIMATLPNIDSLRNKLDKRFEEVSTALNEIEQPINEAEFERWVLPLTTKYNMRVLETDFVPPEVVAPLALTEFPDTYDYKLKELVDSYHNKSADESALMTNDEGLLLSRHRYVVRTTYARYLYMLDDVSEWDTSIYISNSYYDFLNSEAMFEFSVYTVEQLEELDLIDYTETFNSYGTGYGSSSDVAHPELGK